MSLPSQVGAVGALGALQAGNAVPASLQETTLNLSSSVHSSMVPSVQSLVCV